MKLWDGRFSKATDQSVEAFTESVSYDSRLAPWDIRGSIAHARMLGKCGIIPQEASEKIIAGLQDILQEVEKGEFPWDPGAEDVHMNIEKRLHEKIGPEAGMLHTARSRNDQVATDLRLFLKDQILEIQQSVRKLQQTLLSIAEENRETILPGYTHMQHAQPIVLAHHLLAYFWMLQRDRERIADCYHRMDALPLGSAALAGTSFPIDREMVAKELGFAKVLENSMDAVADRDYAVEFLAAAANGMMHLSRLSEEIVLWTSLEFGYLELDDAFATGSSIMPQKKNSDIAELVRGKTGRVYGSLISLLTTLKGLPLAYNRDLQEDKEQIFDAIDTWRHSLIVFDGMMATGKFHKDRMEKATEGDFSTATDVADFLARNGMPFRQAHAVAGKLVKYCLDNGKTLESLEEKELEQLVGGSCIELRPLLSARSSMEHRKSQGGTAPQEVEKQINQAHAALAH